MRTASQTLTTRRFGSTDLELTTVGFGAWAIGVGVGHTAGDRRTIRTPSQPSFVPLIAA